MSKKDRKKLNELEKKVEELSRRYSVFCDAVELNRRLLIEHDRECRALWAQVFGEEDAEAEAGESAEAALDKDLEEKVNGIEKGNEALRAMLEERDTAEGSPVDSDGEEAGDGAPAGIAEEGPAEEEGASEDESVENEAENSADEAALQDALQDAEQDGEENPGVEPGSDGPAGTVEDAPDDAPSEGPEPETDEPGSNAPVEEGEAEEASERSADEGEPAEDPASEAADSEPNYQRVDTEIFNESDEAPLPAGDADDRAAAPAVALEDALRRGDADAAAYAVASAYVEDADRDKEAIRQLVGAAVADYLVATADYAAERDLRALGAHVENSTELLEGIMGRDERSGVHQRFEKALEGAGIADMGTVSVMFHKACQAITLACAEEVK